MIELYQNRLFISIFGGLRDINAFCKHDLKSSKIMHFEDIFKIFMSLSPPNIDKNKHF